MTPSEPRQPVSGDALRAIYVRHLTGDMLGSAFASVIAERFFGLGALILFAATAFAFVPVAMSQSSYARSVRHSFLVPPNAQKHVSVNCPAGAVAASAGVKSQGSGTTTLAIWWTGARVANFRVANARGGSPRAYTDHV